MAWITFARNDNNDVEAGVSVAQHDRMIGARFEFAGPMVKMQVDDINPSGDHTDADDLIKLINKLDKMYGAEPLLANSLEAIILAAYEAGTKNLVPPLPEEEV